MIKKSIGQEPRQKITVDIRPQKPIRAVMSFFYLALALMAGFTTEYHHKL